MHALIVVAHPCGDSFTHANAEAARRGLEAGGHSADTIDLYADRFRAAMSRAERAAYHGLEPIVDAQVADYTERLLAADAVVFVYPTWWSTVPAILKGWCDRVLVPGIGFRFDERSGKVKPGLTNVKRIIGISTYGSPRPYVRVVNDNGRRLIARTIKLSCGWQTRVNWFALYDMDRATDTDRHEFLDRISDKLATLR